MKFNYIYSIGDKVFTKNNTRLTIKERYVNDITPAYWVEENNFIYFEDDLFPVSPCHSIEKEINKKYKTELLDFDADNENLSKYSRNLNFLALNGELAMTYNREKEVDEIRTILLRRTKPNPLLIGQTGCGKTAIVEELARQFVHEHLATNNPYTPIIYDLSLNSLVSGTKYRGDFEERLQKILEIVSENRNIIVFIDEIHQLNSIGNTPEGATSAGQILKPALARGEIRCIGATTIEEHKKYISVDKALNRRFSIVNITPLIGENRNTCIKNILNEYGQYFKIDTTAVKVDTLISILDNCIPHTVFPDNIVDIIDETLAIAKYNNKTFITDTEIKQTASKQHNILIV